MRDLIADRKLMLTLAWKNIAARYKQAYLRHRLGGEEAVAPATLLGSRNRAA